MDAGNILTIIGLLVMYTGSIAGVIMYHNRSQASMHTRVNKLNDKLHDFEKEVGKEYVSNVVSAKLEDRLTRHMDTRFDAITTLINTMFSDNMNKNLTAAGVPPKTA